METNWDDIHAILDMCKSIVISDRETDALEVQDLQCLHRDACVLASAIIISNAIRAKDLNDKP